MIEIRCLQAESGANRFGTCNCCGKSSGEDPLMISIKFSYYGHGTLICLCDECKKKLMEVLPPANNSEIPNSSDTISRAKAIDALDEQIEQCNKSLSSFDISIKDEFAVKVERASLVTFRETLEYLPTAEPQRIKGKWALQSDDYHEYYECDQCGIAVGIDDIRNFCPNCGADMRGEQDG